MGSVSCSITSSCLPRLFCFRALAVLGLVCLLVVGCLGSGIATTESTTLSSSSSSQETFKHKHVIGSTSSDKTVNHAELDFNYMSKRRVPNGPDPIHNRRAGNSGRPPGQA
ncbi:CLAVATA3/ESR (CLE)-related protein 25 [Senna tora]|uniref:CLAVATA3/ESR (CLE)-related protein 25 n=1 Tax=Senna tora TaxID=362788 RepID=A0A834W9W4_9FABA|nr:CLAVATA3/ESR (CLE)-related protein 25 [Senna tora]